MVAGLTRNEVRNGSPLDMCEALVGERGDRSANSFSKALRELRDSYGEARGTSIFRDCLESLWNDLAEGAPIRNRGAVFNSKLKKWSRG